MKVIIAQSVLLFLQEYNIKISKQMKIVIEQLKVNPKMYTMISNDENIRHFVIKNIEFGYVIDHELIIISDCRFVKSNIKLKVMKNQ